MFIVINLAFIKEMWDTCRKVNIQMKSKLLTGKNECIHIFNFDEASHLCLLWGYKKDILQVEFIIWQKREAESVGDLRVSANHFSFLTIATVRSTTKAVRRYSYINTSGNTAIQGRETDSIQN